ncbi:MAG: hypothetical protein ABJC89_24385 [Acidobacteriota bacterium]
MIEEIALMLRKIGGVAIVILLVERRAVAVERLVLFLQLAGPLLQALMFFSFGFRHRGLSLDPRRHHIFEPTVIELDSILVRYGPMLDDRPRPSAD